jgi:hypothetical protein
MSNAPLGVAALSQRRYITSTATPGAPVSVLPSAVAVQRKPQRNSPLSDCLAPAEQLTAVGINFLAYDSHPLYE